MNPAADDFDSLLELGKLLDEAGLTICVWDGAPPCPKCGGSHGFSKVMIESPAWAKIRARIEAKP